MFVTELAEDPFSVNGRADDSVDVVFVAATVTSMVLRVRWAPTKEHAASAGSS